MLNKTYVLRLSALLWICLHAVLVSAQLTIKLESVPSTPANPAIYLAGNFNGWNPGLAAYLLTKDASGQYSITFQPPAGNLEFKFTRGSWATVETTAGGGDIANRKFVYSGQPTELKLSVAGWKGAVTSTASPNVVLMNNQFPITSLQRTRAIWLYLPPSYASDTTRRYPVLYMLDGQNLFDAALAFSGEWKIDETLDKLHLDQQKDYIVVGIANGGNQRLNEYSPWVNTQYGGGQGDLFLQFITDELKPYIDTRYRTLKDAQHTAIAGSSMGGLFSFYAGFKRPDVFSKIGAFSSSFWFSPQVYTWLSSLSLSGSGTRVYLTAGTAEGGNQVGDMLKMRDLILDRGLSPNQLKADADPGKGHNESYWAEKFPTVLNWLFDPITSATTIDDKDSARWILCADSTCYYTGPECTSCTVQISDLSGQKLRVIQLNDDRSFTFPEGATGVYIFSLYQKEKLLHSEKALINR